MLLSGTEDDCDRSEEHTSELQSRRGVFPPSLNRQKNGRVFLPGSGAGPGDREGGLPETVCHVLYFHRFL